MRRKTSIGKTGTTENLLYVATNMEFKEIRCDIAAKELWRRGLNIQNHIKRVQEEEERSRIRHAKFIEKAKKIRISKKKIKEAKNKKKKIATNEKESCMK